MPSDGKKSLQGRMSKVGRPQATSGQAIDAQQSKSLSFRWDSQRGEVVADIDDDSFTFADVVNQGSKKPKDSRSLHSALLSQDKHPIIKAIERRDKKRVTDKQAGLRLDQGVDFKSKTQENLPAKSRISHTDRDMTMKELIHEFAANASEKIGLDGQEANDFQKHISEAIALKERQIKIARLPANPIRDYDWRKDDRNVISYLRSDEGFKKWLELDALNRPLLKDLAPKAYQALSNYLKKNSLPNDINIPTKAQLSDQILSEQDTEEKARAYTTVRNRRYMKRKNPSISKP